MVAMQEHRILSTGTLLVSLLGGLFLACGVESPDGKLPEAKTKRELQDLSLPKAALSGLPFGDFSADDVEVFVRDALARRDFDAVEQEAERLLADQRDDRNANELRRLYRAISRLGDDGESEIEAALDSWVASRPDSHVALTARGEYRIGHAWEVRGTDWAREVPPERLKRFHDELQLARGDLEKAARLSSLDPNPHASLITIAMVFGEPRQLVEERYRRAIELAPGHLFARIAKLHYLNPKWGGSFEEMMDFAWECRREAERHPHAALVLAEALSQVSSWPEITRPTTFLSLLGRTRQPVVPEHYLTYAESWREVEEAYELFFERYPDDLEQRVRYVHIAYFARQWDVVVEQAEIIGARWRVWDSDDTLDRYRRKVSRAYLLYSEETEQPHDRARFFCAQAVAVDPRDPEARFEYAHALHTSGMFAEAEQQYQKAVELNPQDAASWAGLIMLAGRSWRGCGRVSELLIRSRGVEFGEEDGRRIAKIAEACDRWRQRGAR